MKKIISVSMLAIITAMPAFADNITNNSMCVVGVLNQSDNNTTANINAMWSANTYSENPGYYLQFSNGEITQNVQCPAGSYCEGFTNQTFNDATMGLNACPTGYANSAVGTTTQNECYNQGTATCSTRNPYSGANPTKVLTVTYGNATNGSATCKTYYGDQTTCVLDTATACDITDITCDTGYRKTTLLTFVPVSELQSYASTKGTSREYRALNGDSGNNSDNSTGMTNGDWQVGWSDGTYVHGHSTCVAQNVTTNPWNNNNTWTDGDSRLGANALTAGQYNDTDARYCWCQMDSYALAGGASVASAGAWVFSFDNGSASSCADDCANNCARNVRPYSPFRAAVFGSLGTNMECTANTINLNWYADATSQTPLTVDTASQTCTYDQRITIPSTEPTKPGYTFAGWTLRQ